MERYNVPKPLVGRSTPRGASVPARIFPVFRDRDELPSAVDLGAVINQALEDSECLIVICSPSSAQSQWVNQEILNYKRLGREHRVFAMIVAGEPNAGDGRPGFTADQECFPPALKFKLAADRNLSSTRTEPIAADGRPNGDGKLNALLKLIAGILDVSYDELKQRDEIQRRRRQRLVLATVSGVAAIISALAIAVSVQWKEAVVQRKNALAKGEEAKREGEEAVLQRTRATEEASAAEMELARVSLETGRPRQAAVSALSAIELSESIGRSQEAAWWILRRALDSERVAQLWRAHADEVAHLEFNQTGTLLLTVSVQADEARVWAVADSKPMAKIQAGPGLTLAGWTGAEEIVTVNERERSVGQGWSATREHITELNWWSADGTKLRTLELPDCGYSSVAPTSSPLPAWIGVWDAKKAVYRLVRLRDGWSELSIPAKRDIRGGLKIIPECSVALLADPAVGVRIYSMQDGRELGRLQGIGPADRFSMRDIAFSTDGEKLAAKVEIMEGLAVRVREVAVWHVRNGSRLFSYKPPEAGTDHWLRNLGHKQLAGYPEPMVSAIAAKLGLVPRPLRQTAVSALAWRADAAPQSTLAVLSHYGDLALVHQGIELSPGLKTHPAKTTAIAHFPNAELLASGDDRGNVYFWSTTPAFRSSDVLPAGLEVVDDPLVKADRQDRVIFSKAPNRILLWNAAQDRLVADVPVSPSERGKNRRYVWPGSTDWLVEVPFWVSLEQPPKEWQALFYDPTAAKVLGRRAVRYGLYTSPQTAHAVAWGQGWELLTARGGELIVTPLEQPAGVRIDTRQCFTFAHDGSKLISATADGWFVTFATNTGKTIRSFRFAPDVGERGITDLSLSSSGRWALAHSTTAERKSWCVDLLNETATEIPAAHGSLYGARFLEDESLIVHGDGQVARWFEVSDFRLVASVRSASGSNDIARVSGTDLLMLRSSREVMLVEARTGREFPPYDNVLAADATVGVAVVETENGVRVVRLRDREVLAEAHERAESAVISTDGAVIHLVRRVDKRVITLPLTYDQQALRARGERIREWQSGPAAF